MDYGNNNRFKKSLLTEEDANLSAFRRRNKLLILILLFLIISLTVIIGALIIFLLPNDTASHPPQSLVNPAVEAFCTASNDQKSCLSSFNPVISPKSKTNPNQIFTLSLQTAAKKLDGIIPQLSNTSDGNRTESIALKKCSVYLRDGLSRIGYALAAMRVNPLVENQSEEQMIEMMNWIYTAWEDLESCVDELDEAATAAVSELKKEVLRAKEYVNNGQDFLRRYGSVLQIYSSGMVAGDNWGLNLEIVFSVCTCLLELLFVFVLFWSLFRVVRTKSQPQF